MPLQQNNHLPRITELPVSASVVVRPIFSAGALVPVPGTPQATIIDCQRFLSDEIQREREAFAPYLSLPPIGEEDFEAEDFEEEDFQEDFEIVVHSVKTQEQRSSLGEFDFVCENVDKKLVVQLRHHSPFYVCGINMPHKYLRGEQRSFPREQLVSSFPDGTLHTLLKEPKRTLEITTPGGVVLRVQPRQPEPQPQPEPVPESVPVPETVPQREDERDVAERRTPERKPKESKRTYACKICRNHTLEHANHGNYASPSGLWYHMKKYHGAKTRPYNKRPKSAKKSAKKPARKGAKKGAKKSARKGSKKSAKKGAKKPAKKSMRNFHQKAVELLLTVGNAPPTKRRKVTL